MEKFARKMSQKVIHACYSKIVRICYKYFGYYSVSINKYVRYKGESNKNVFLTYPINYIIN